ncbi:MAG: hypothetical protein N2Z65_04420 [Clostridiales bacterium]|nr:hypothetical protein [Clostridiales bacterium]
MRLADVTVTRNYMSSLTKNTEQLYKLNTKVSSQRSYQKASEDPSTAAKANQVRRTLSRISDYQSNISEIQSTLTEKESAISEIYDVVSEACTKIQQGSTGTYSETDRKTIAESLKSVQSSILNFANSKYCEKYVFGGNDSYELPFILDTDGKLLYHGEDVDTGTFDSEAVYCDIGLGLSKDSSGEIIPGTAYNIANSGTELLGAGVDENGLTNNIYNLIGDIVSKFESNDLTDIKTYSDKLEQLSDNILLEYTKVGEQSSFINFISDKMDTSKTNATEKQTDLEGADSAQSILEYSQQQFSYNANLQMGASLIQKTLLDYIK